MNTEFEYDRNAAQLDRQLEDVMDSHRSELAQAETQAKEAEALSVEPPALDRLLSTTKDQVNEVKSRGKQASVVLQEEMVRDRLREFQASGLVMVDGFLKEAGAADTALRLAAQARASKAVGKAFTSKATRNVMGRAKSVGAEGAAKATAQKRFAEASVGKRLGPKSMRSNPAALKHELAEGASYKSMRAAGKGRAAAAAKTSPSRMAAREGQSRAYIKGTAAGAQVSKAVRKATAPVKRVASAVNQKLVRGPVGDTTRAIGRTPAFKRMHGAISGFKRGLTGR